MNVSMQDTYNLAWKIASVVRGQTQPKILATYQTERRKVAQELIAMDHEVARFYSVASVSRNDYQTFRNQYSEFMSGIAVTYEESMLVQPQIIDEGPPETSPASKVALGARLASYQILKQADAGPIQTLDLLRSDGRWRILLFAGDLTNEKQGIRIQELGDGFRYLLEQFTPPGQPVDCPIELLMIHSASRTAVELLDLHEIYHPWDHINGWDYDKIFVDDKSHYLGFEDAYGGYGIDRSNGCVIVCRPDQHVGCKAHLDKAFRVLEDYFGRILSRQR